MANEQFTLLMEVSARGLSVIGADALRGVWHNTVGPAPWGTDTVLSLLLQEPSLNHYVLNLAGFDLSEHSVADQSLPLSQGTLVDVIYAVAKQFSHKTINEVHLFHALLELYPLVFEQRIESLQKQYLQKFPHGTARRRNLLRAANAADNQWLATKVLESLEQTPYTRSKILGRLKAYLSSVYYPFGPDKWRSYEHDRNEGKLHDHSAYNAEGFAAHRLRDEFLLKTQ